MKLYLNNRLISTNKNQFNLSEILELIIEEHPEYDKILRNKEDFFSNVVVFVNHVDIKYKDRFETIINEKDVVKIILLKEDENIRYIDIRDFSCPTPRYVIKIELMNMQPGEKIQIISYVDHEFKMSKFVKQNGVKILKKNIIKPIVKYYLEKIEGEKNNEKVNVFNHVSI